MGQQRKFYETDDFVFLQKSWYQKLETMGFTDQEKIIGRKLVLTDGRVYNKYGYLRDRLRIDVLEYHLFMSSAIEQHEFESERDRLIITLRAEGCKICEISLELNKNGYHVHRQTIRFIIRRFEHKWGIRVWEKDQMTSNLATK